MTIRLVSSLTLAACLAITSIAHADGVELKRTADEAFDGHHYEEAAEKYEASYAEKKDPSVLYNLARTYEALGKYPEALDRLQRFDSFGPYELRKKVPKLDALLEKYRARVATLTVHSNVNGARIIVRNVIVGETADEPTKLKVNVGSATIEVSKDGYKPWRRTFALDSVSVTKIEANLDEKSTTTSAPAAATADTEASAPTTTASPPLYQRWYFWAGVGAVVLVATTITLFVALNTERDPDRGTFGNGTLIVARSVPWVSF